jgi:hypothetical protein
MSQYVLWLRRKAADAPGNLGASGHGQTHFLLDDVRKLPFHLSEIHCPGHHYGD